MKLYGSESELESYDLTVNEGLCKTEEVQAIKGGSGHAAESEGKRLADVSCEPRAGRVNFSAASGIPPPFLCPCFW
jgi:hypothetical protein